MSHLITVCWIAWCACAALLAAGLVVLSMVRRRHLARTGDEATRAVLPTWRDDLAWGGLVLLGGGVGLGVILGLLVDGHTARGILAAAVFGLVMLLGLAMLLKNGLAPTDVLRLDVEDSVNSPAPEVPEGEAVEAPTYWKPKPGF